MKKEEVIKKTRKKIESLVEDCDYLHEYEIKYLDPYYTFRELSEDEEDRLRELNKEWNYKHEQAVLLIELLEFVDKDLCNYYKKKYDSWF